MAIIWQEEYSVGVKEIDQQHQHFIGILNGLYTAITEQQVTQAIEKIINDLVVYATNHFATEEKYFDLFNYEFSVEHKAEHQKLTTKVLALKKAYEAGQEVATELLDFLEDWLVDHLSVQDKKYVKCFHDHGLF
ncbi:MAG: bacteriohemerythrin [Candidatus Buchananbacteria bacterium]